MVEPLAQDAARLPQAMVYVVADRDRGDQGAAIAAGHLPGGQHGGDDAARKAIVAVPAARRDAVGEARKLWKRAAARAENRCSALCFGIERNGTRDSARRIVEPRHRA